MEKLLDKYLKESYNYSGKMVDANVKSIVSDALDDCKKLQEKLDILFDNLERIITTTEFNLLDGYRKDLRHIGAFLTNLRHVWVKNK